MSWRTVRRSRRARLTMSVYRLLAPSISSSDGRSAGSSRSSGRSSGSTRSGLGQLHAGVLGLDEAVQLVLLLPRLGLRGADDGHDAGQHDHRGGVAAPLDGPPLEVGVERLRVLQRLLRREHRLRVPGGQVLAVLRRARLHQQRVGLRRPRGGQGTRHGEVRADVPDRVDARGVAPDARLLVADLGVVLPRVPQLERRPPGTPPPARSARGARAARRARSCAPPRRTRWSPRSSRRGRR